MENTFLTKEDFNIEEKYKRFDVIFIVPSCIDKPIEEFMVIGNYININKDKRCLDYNIISHPISKFVMKNKHSTIQSQRQDTIFLTREEANARRIEQINTYAEEMKNKLL